MERIIGMADLLSAPRKWTSVLFISVSVLFAAGCDNVPRTLSGLQPYYHPGLVRYTVENGEMATVIHGLPFGGEQIDSNQAVAAALTLPGFYPQAQFRPVLPGVRPEGGYVVFAFDPANKGLSAQSLCRDAGPVASHAAEGALHLVGAFCYDDTLASDITAQAPRPQSAGDPDFRAFMALVMADLLPPIDPNEGRDCPAKC